MKKEVDKIVPGDEEYKARRGGKITQGKLRGLRKVREVERDGKMCEKMSK